MDLFLSLFPRSFVCVAELHNNRICRKSETCPSFTDELIIIHRHICSERDLLPLKKFTSLRSRADWKRLGYESVRRHDRLCLCLIVLKERLKSVSVQRRQSGLICRGTRHRFMCHTRTSSCVHVFFGSSHTCSQHPWFIFLNAYVSVSV